jgi:branched-subunit amino acid aminotransferase/4-amino-4-deoxychorismate lyase
MEDHLARLTGSARQMNLRLPLSLGEIEDVIHVLLSKNALAYSSIKVIVTGGESADGFSPGKPQIIILNNPFSDPPEAIYKSGVSLMLHEYLRDLPQVKSTAYARALSLQAEWNDAGHIDVLYHQNGLVSEVSRSNVYYFEGDTLRTNVADVLQGVTRKNVLKCAEELFNIQIAPIELSSLLAAEEVFITSSTKKVLPIVRIGEQPIGDGQVGGRTKKLMMAFESYIDKYVAVKQRS